MGSCADDPADELREAAGDAAAEATTGGAGTDGAAAASEAGLAGAGAGTTGVVAGGGVGVGTEAEEVAAASVIVVVSGTVSTRPGRRCALVRRWFSSASDSIETP